jgi:hypothetical protein
MLNLRTLWDFARQFPCLHLSQAPELFGPTDVNAQTGNQSLSVGLNGDGTVTVFRWPRPSFYDQLKYHTTDRDESLMGADPNAGSFLGLVVSEGGYRRTTWLRDWETTQRYANDRSDAVETTHRSDAFGLTVTVTDVVDRDADALVRDVTVSRDPDADADPVSLVAFENYALVVTKEERHPVEDWCHDGHHEDSAAYRPGPDAVVHAAAGVDESVDERRSVATVLAFGGASDGHQVGGDAAVVGGLPASHADAYRDAADGRLTGNDASAGATTGALRRRLDFDGGEASAQVYLCAAESEAAALDVLSLVRDRDPGAVRADKRSWFDDLVGDAPMPDAEDDAVRALARRALVTLVTNYDPETGAVVASIATQSPYGLDWPRDGAYFNHVLDTLGLSDWVTRRLRWYADLQEQPDRRDGNHRQTPVGNWAMNYYADGVIGGPIPYEIDQTGYAVWSMWDHFTVVEDEAFLRDVYPAMRHAAEFFVEHRDPSTGLHRRAYEDDNVVRSQTIVGAGPVWLGLDAAARAAGRLDHHGDAHRFRERRDELAAAIEEHLWNDRAGAYAGGHPSPAIVEGVPYLSDLLARLPLVPNASADASLYWPIGFGDVSDDRMRRHVERVREQSASTWDEPEADEDRVGMYDVKTLITLARASRDDPADMAEVRRGVRWVANRHATDDTRVMGEAWMRRDDDIVTGVSQPHTWSQLLFYYASLEAFPPPDAPDLDAGEGVVDHLRSG